jgi:hypothetical protein
MSQQKDFEQMELDGLTVLQPDGPAKIFQLPASAPASKALDRDCGESVYVFLGRFDPVTRYLKTLQLSLVETMGDGLSRYSATFPRSGIMRNGTVYERQTSGLGIAGIESGLLPTPTATDYGTNQGGAAGRSGKTRPSLGTMARNALFPTPTVYGNNNRADLSRKAGDGLATFVKKYPEGEILFPTPINTDYKGSVSLETAKRRAEESCRGVRLAEHITLTEGTEVAGNLCPEFVELLMGFPAGWTDLEV